MKFLFKLLDFLSILDDSGTRISWTNVGLAAVLMKFVVAQSVDWQSLVALVSVLANYGHRRYVASKGSDDGSSIPQVSPDTKP